MMTRDQLDKAFGQPSPAFHDRITFTLHTLQEEPPMKRFTLRTALVALLILALLCGAAYALVTQGQEWYYQNRFTAYQEHEPEKLASILQHLQTELPQSTATDGTVSITIQDAAWVPEAQLFTLSAHITSADADRFELHHLATIDVDGAYYGSDPIPSDDEDGHAAHFLWTNDAHGPIPDMMTDPSKQLQLFSEQNVRIGAPDASPVPWDHCATDVFDATDGGVIIVHEYSQPSADVLAAITEHTDEHGLLTLCLPYCIYPYDPATDTISYDRPQTGTLTFYVDTTAVADR